MNVGIGVGPLHDGAEVAFRDSLWQAGAGNAPRCSGENVRSALRLCVLPMLVGACTCAPTVASSGAAARSSRSLVFSPDVENASALQKPQALPGVKPKWPSHETTYASGTLKFEPFPMAPRPEGTPCSKDGWCSVFSGASSRLDQIWASGSDNVWVIGERVMRFDGKKWAQVTVSTHSGSFGGVWGTGPNDVWLSSYDSFHHWDGSSWTRFEAPEKSNYNYRLWGFSSKDVWAVYDKWLAHWDGERWSAIHYPAPAVDSRDPDFQIAWASRPDDLWAIPSSRQLSFRSMRPDLNLVPLRHFDGTSWTDLNDKKDMHGIGGTGPDDVWIAGRHGFIEHWDGKAWKGVPSGATLSLGDVHAISPTDAWIYSADTRDDDELPKPGAHWVDPRKPEPKAGYLFLHWDGNKWTDEKAPSTGALSVWRFADGTALAIRNDGSVYRREPGAKWKSDLSGNWMRTGFRGMWGASPADVWFSGHVSLPEGPTMTPKEHGMLLHKQNGNYSYALLDEGGFGSIWGSSAKDVWFAGSVGIAHWDGTAWKFTYTPSGISSVFGFEPNDVWAVGQRGTILHWIGELWAPTTGPIGGMTSLDDGTISADFSGVFGFAPNDLWVVGTDGMGGGMKPVTLHWDGHTWTKLEVASPRGFMGVWGVSPDSIWAWSPDGPTYHWDGHSWTSVGSVLGSWTLSHVWGKSPSDLWGAKGSELIHGDGTEWKQQDTGTRDYIGSIWGTDADHVWVTGLGGDLLERNAQSSK